MIDELLVFVAGRLAGVARRRAAPDHHLVAFRYDNAYIAGTESTPLSLGMPVAATEYEISRWLDGLLPDKRDVRVEWAQQQGAQAVEPVSMLATPIGLDCAGAVQFCQPGEEEVISDRGSGVEWHTDTEIAAWVRKAKQGQRELLSSQVRYSLGGWQTKVALCRDGDRWGTPFGQRPTTWILKPGIDPQPGRIYPDSDLVEHVTMAAAARAGLDVARTSVERFAGERVLAVERDDRTREAGWWLRSHQEDLCQAFDIAPNLKYQEHGGPTPEGIIDLLRRESSSADNDIARFLDALIFNWAIGGIDAHSKNYSVLLTGGLVSLAPLYDLMSFLPYRSAQSVSKIATAMLVGEDYTLAAADHCSAWEQAARRFGLEPGQVAARAEHILGCCPDAFDAVIAGLDSDDQRSPQLAALTRDLRQRRDDVFVRFPRPARGGSGTDFAAGRLPLKPDGAEGAVGASAIAASVFTTVAGRDAALAANLIWICCLRRSARARPLMQPQTAV